MTIREGKEFDVIVAGAGCAGFCATVQAGRSGLNTALFEHFAMPGGALTDLGSNSIDQFNNPHRPAGDRQVIAGIGWEFVRELERRGFAEIPDMDAPYRVHWQYGVKVNPIAAAQCMDDFLLEAGVHLFYRQGIVAVETTDTPSGIRVDAVIVTTKDGPVRHRARFFIDCTGDGDLCAWAGAKYEIGGSLQPGTIRLYPCGDASQSDLAKADRIWQEQVAKSPELSDMLCSGRFEDFLRSGGDNTNHVCGLNTADSDDRTLAEIRSRRDQVRLLSALKQSGAPVHVLASAPESAARESRRILGDAYMTGEDYLPKRVYEDAVCYTYWFIDIHRENRASEIVYLQDENTPTVPLGALRPRGLANVYIAGRCVSSDRPANSAIRVKASCMAMGQAAGAAVVQAVRRGDADTRSININELRAYLTGQGAIVPQ
ncbi:MAG: FAD-dependent oxidoreductase [Clostridia bacterium]|nr:FAD-dependent oxidoreductase [Clostridia bacterium]